MLLEVFRTLGDETRVRILNLLGCEPLCVCEVQDILGINQSGASRHLSRLKSAGLICSEKRAQWVYYRLNGLFFAEHEFLVPLLAEIGRTGQGVQDKARLKTYRELGGGCGNSVRCDDSAVL